MTAELMKPKLVQHATDIFTRLVGDAVRVTDKGVTMTTDPANLAVLSFKLADAFQKVEDQINADAMPKTGFNLQEADISGWKA
jgi:hypothetical protein